MMMTIIIMMVIEAMTIASNAFVDAFVDAHTHTQRSNIWAP